MVVSTPEVGGDEDFFEIVEQFGVDHLFAEKQGVDLIGKGFPGLAEFFGQAGKQRFFLFFLGCLDLPTL